VEVETLIVSIYTVRRAGATNRTAGSFEWRSRTAFRCRHKSTCTEQRGPKQKQQTTPARISHARNCVRTEGISSIPDLSFYFGNVWTSGGLSSRTRVQFQRSGLTLGLRYIKPNWNCKEGVLVQRREDARVLSTLRVTCTPGVTRASHLCDYVNQLHRSCSAQIWTCDKLTPEYNKQLCALFPSMRV